jgi:hypothetical protein
MFAYQKYHGVKNVHDFEKMFACEKETMEKYKWPFLTWVNDLRARKKQLIYLGGET